jgi:hypothetical protein
MNDMTVTERINKRIKGYSRLHRWVRKLKGNPTYCSFNKNHTAKRFEYANISKEYKKDISDYISLCPSCHRKYDWTKEQSIKIALSKKGKVGYHTYIKQFSKNGEFIKKWFSLAEASRNLGISRTGISNVLRGDTKTSGGFIWAE